MRSSKPRRGAESVNEELQTVNLELSAEVEALGRAHDDLQNLFDSTDVATVFLDRGLLIRSLTPASTRIFNLLPGDRGRSISNLSSRFAMPDLGQDIDAVLRAGEAVERGSIRKSSGPLPRPARPLSEQRPPYRRRGGELYRDHRRDPGRTRGRPRSSNCITDAQPARRCPGDRHPDAGPGHHLEGR